MNDSAKPQSAYAAAGVNIDNKIRVRISDINPRSRIIAIERLYLDLKIPDNVPQAEVGRMKLIILGTNVEGGESILTGVTDIPASSSLTTP